MADDHEIIAVSGFTSQLLQGLYSMQQQGKLCDAHIHTAGGVVPAHRIVLMAGSMFFRCNEDRQSVPNFCHTNTYLLSEQKADIENIICFLYLGRVCVSLENVERLIKLGSFLQLHSMVEVCKSYAEKFKKVEPSFDTYQTSMKTGDSNCLNNTGFFMARELVNQNIIDKVTDCAAGQVVTVGNNDSSLNVSKDKSNPASNAEKTLSDYVLHPTAMDSVGFEKGACESDTRAFSIEAKTQTDHLFQRHYNSSSTNDVLYCFKKNPGNCHTELNQTSSDSYSCMRAADHKGQSFHCDLCFTVFADEKDFDLHRKNVHAEVYKSFDSSAGNAALSEHVDVQLSQIEIVNLPSVAQKQQSLHFDDAHNAFVNKTSKNSSITSPSGNCSISTSNNENIVIQTALNKPGNQIKIQRNVGLSSDAPHKSENLRNRKLLRTRSGVLLQKCKNKKQIESPVVDKDYAHNKCQQKVGRFSNTKVNKNKHVYDISKVKNKIPKKDKTGSNRVCTHRVQRKMKREKVESHKRSVKDLKSENVKFVHKSERKIETLDNADTEIVSQEGDTKLFVCRRCMESFPTHQERSEHIKTAHAGGIVVCNICNFSFKNVDWKYLMEHRYKKHNQMLETDKCPVYSCTEQGCGYKTLFKARYKHHMDLVHLVERLFTCTECQKSFKCQKNLNVHQRTHLESYIREVFQCEQCGKKFKANSSLKRHIEKVHEKIDEAKQLCHLCTYQATNYRSMHNHLLKAHGIQPPKHVKVYQCSKCDFITLTKSHLSEHEGGHGGSSSQYVCQVCGKIFHTERRLNNHSKIHTAEELACPYDECNFHCKEKKNLRRHIQRQHDPTNYKPYGCPHCNYFCKEKGNLNKHITGKHKMEVVTLYKLRQKAMETGKGYPNISCNEYSSGQMSTAQSAVNF